MEFWPAEYVIERGYAVAAINVAAEVEPDNAKATTGIRAFYAGITRNRRSSPGAPSARGPGRARGR